MNQNNITNQPIHAGVVDAYRGSPLNLRLVFPVGYVIPAMSAGVFRGQKQLVEELHPTIDTNGQARTLSFSPQQTRNLPTRTELVVYLGEIAKLTFALDMGRQSADSPSRTEVEIAVGEEFIFLVKIDPDGAVFVTTGVTQELIDLEARIHADAQNVSEDRDETEGFRDEAEAFRDAALQSKNDAANSATAADTDALAVSNMLTMVETKRNEVSVNTVTVGQKTDSIVQLYGDANALNAAKELTQGYRNDAQSYASSLSPFAIGLKNFYDSLRKVNTTRINVRVVGTSISSFRDSVCDLTARSIAKYFGESASKWNPFAEQAGQSVAGWTAQSYSGTYSVRLKGGNGGSALPFTRSLQARKLIIFYSTEPDGGTCAVSIKSGSNAPVSVAAINCQGGTSIGNYVEYELDPNYLSTFTITAPNIGFGYLEYRISDVGDRGVMYINTSFGGSSLGNHSGSKNLPGAATPSGDLGLIATFAPTHPSVKPHLLIYCGPTNDSAPYFQADLIKAVGYAVANGSSILLVIEPINGSAGRANWDILRAGFYAAKTAYPDNVYVYDWDRFLSPDLSYQPKYHANTYDPHPADYGSGDPNLAGGMDLCQKLGIPFDKYIRHSDIQNSASYKQPTEPLAAQTGSLWLDTSHSDETPMLKRLLFRQGPWKKGLWQCEDGRNRQIAKQADLVTLAGAALTKNYLYQEAVSTNTSISLSLPKSLFQPGKRYTASFLFDGEQFGTMVTHLYIGASLKFLTANADEKMVVSASPVANSTVTNAPGDTVRVALTFQYPTQDELDSAAAQGVNTSGDLRITFIAAFSVKFTIWNFSVEAGASMTNGVVEQGARLVDYAMGGKRQATEPPITAPILNGQRWADTSLVPAVEKRLVSEGAIFPINNVKLATRHLWQNVGTGNTNALPEISTASLVIAAGVTSAVVSNALGRRGDITGILAAFGEAPGGGSIVIQYPVGAVVLEYSTVYTLSFGIDVTKTSSSTFFPYVQIARQNNSPVSNLYLEPNLNVWSPGGKNAIAPYGHPYTTPNFRRVAVTFTTMTAQQEIGGHLFFNMGFSSLSNASLSIYDLRLEKGASVTID